MEENTYYLRILEDGFTFLLVGFHDKNDFLDSDIPISEKDYLKWNEECSFKQFRVKANPIGSTLFDYIEEYTPEPLPPVPPSDMELLQEEVLNQSEMILEMDFRLTSIELGL